MRDFITMRNVLATAAKAQHELCYNDFWQAGTDDVLEKELVRLTNDGLLDAEVYFGDEFGGRSKCSVAGLTPEGMEFFKLIENDKAWELVLGVLRKADIDISYPLLKEVCEEIVKRYVVSFIPEIK